MRKDFGIYEAWAVHPLPDAMMKMVDLYRTGKFDLYLERVMAFDEWEPYLPIMTKESVIYPEQELKPEFYKNKKEVRNKPKKFGSYYIDKEPNNVNAGRFNQIRRSLLDQTGVEISRFALNL